VTRLGGTSAKRMKVMASCKPSSPDGGCSHAKTHESAETKEDVNVD
jgi:hypothetical protein